MKIGGLLVEQRRVELLASALRTAKFEFYGPLFRPLKLDKCADHLNKNAAANKISTATNYDPERPSLTNFGNELATERLTWRSAKIKESSGFLATAFMAKSED